MSAIPAPTKAKAARAILAAAAAPVRFDRLHKKLERKLKMVIGRHVLYQLMAGMKHKKEVETVGRGDDTWYYLKPKGRK
jgi:hypothetical protein